MSLFPFAPSPTTEHRIALHKGAFSSEEIDKLIALLETLTRRAGQVGSAKSKGVVLQYRNSEVGWLTLNDRSRWVYERLADAARLLNGRYFHFDLYGFHNHMQYTVYKGEESGHYDWHVDSGNMGATNPPRKLSLVLQLSDPSEYEGGDLEIMTGSNPKKVEKQKGLLVAFPSYTLHRVTPVTSGIRRSLVVWVCGPAFR